MSLTGRQIIVADPATQEYLRGIGENVQDVFHALAFLRKKIRNARKAQTQDRYSERQTIA
jgi:hypothetical protein